jgi:RNA-splicing ligase RtcB
MHKFLREIPVSHKSSDPLTHRLVMVAAMHPLPDRELACVPLRVPEDRDYDAAMCAAANFTRPGVVKG